MANIGIIGAGSWGIALSILLYNNGNKVTVWSVIEDEIKMLNEKREHERCLPGVKLPDDMVFTTDLEHTIKNAELLVLAVPSVYTRSTSKSMSGYVREGQIIVNVAKGIEENTLKTLTETECYSCHLQEFVFIVSVLDTALIIVIVIKVIVVTHITVQTVIKHTVRHIVTIIEV